MTQKTSATAAGVLNTTALTRTDKVENQQNLPLNLLISPLLTAKRNVENH